MSKRVRLPGADELFRQTPTTVDRAEGSSRTAAGSIDPFSAEPVPATEELDPSVTRDAASKRAVPGPSGRVRHDEKFTVYVTADELLDLDRTRLSLRAEHGLAVDRGRIVREAIHLAMESVAADGEDSPLVRRLRER